ncbi:MAG: hypothetical protein IT239_06765 [Bacteroidia bacterium]|nr:hypothetical protein [Bacteroidia bacterium]
MSKSVFYLIIFFIIIFSFSFHSALFSPILNSDNGVVILMIYNFRLPDDLYFWGQDRFGSLIPLIGQIFYKGLRFSPIVSESISHYLLLILGFFGFADLFKSNFSKISFAIVWFLPPLRMVDLLSGTLGEQYALIGVAVFLINKLYPVKNEIYSFRQYLFLSLIALVFIACIWVSDLACSTIFILLTVHTIFLFKNSKPNYSKIFKRPEIYYIIIGIITAVFFISYAKGNATSLKNYDSFSLNVFVDSIAVFKTTIVDLILFKSQEPLTSIYLYFILAFIIYIVYRHRNISYSNNNLKWITIFVLDIIVVFVILLSSKWSLLNGVPRRYFVGNYISFWIVFFLVLESIHLSMNIQFFKILILLTLIIVCLGTLYKFK